MDEFGKYDMYCTNIDNGDGRGCIPYVSYELQAVEVHFDTKFEENVFLSINLQNRDRLLVGVIYISLNSGDNNNSLPHNMITEVSNANYFHILIMGYFNLPNIDLDNWDPHGDSTETIENKFNRMTHPIH